MQQQKYSNGLSPPTARIHGSDIQGVETGVALLSVILNNSFTELLLPLPKTVSSAGFDS